MLWYSQQSRSRCFFWNSLAFLMIQLMLVIWFLVPLPFLNPAWTKNLQLNNYGRVEGHVLIFCENSEITTRRWITINRRMLDPTKKHTPHPRAKEKPQQDRRRGKIVFRTNPIPARHAQRAQTNLVCTRPHRDWTSLGSLKESWCLGSTDSDSALSGYGFSIELMKSFPGGSDVMPGLRTTHLSKYSLVPSFLSSLTHFSYVQLTLPKYRHSSVGRWTNNYNIVW